MTKLSQPLPVNGETGSQQHFKFHDLREIICLDFCFVLPFLNRYLFSFRYLTALPVSSHLLSKSVHLQSSEISLRHLLGMEVSLFLLIRLFLYFSLGFSSVLSYLPTGYLVSSFTGLQSLSLGRSWSYLIKVKLYIKINKNWEDHDLLLISSLNLFVGNQTQMSQWKLRLS